MADFPEFSQVLGYSYYYVASEANVKKLIIETLFFKGPMMLSDLKNTLAKRSETYSSVDFSISLDKLRSANTVRTIDTDLIGDDLVELVEDSAGKLEEKC